MQTALYGKIKERRETGNEWLIGANTQNITYLSIVTTQQSRVRFLLMRIETRKARRCAGAY